MRLALGRDGSSLRNFPPLLHAATTTAGTGVLGKEYGVVSHRRLPAVVWRCRERETSADEILAMAADRLHALLGDVLPVVGREMKARAELRLCEPPKCLLPSRLSRHKDINPPIRRRPFPTAQAPVPAGRGRKFHCGTGHPSRAGLRFTYLPLPTLVGTDAAKTLRVLESFDMLLNRAAGNAGRGNHSRKCDLRIAAD